MMQGPYFTVPAGSKERPCQGCAKPIYWIVTEKGHKMPVDCRADERCRVATDAMAGSGLSHFATCPKADRFRKPR
jgi:hypothetical protein